MKRTLKIWSLVVVAVLLLTAGCVIAFADETPAPIVVKAGNSFDFTQNAVDKGLAADDRGTFTNGLGQEVTFTWNATAEKYVLGVVGIETNDIETTYNGEEQTAETLYYAGNDDALTYTITPDGVNPAEFGLTCRVNFSVGGTAEIKAGEYENVLHFSLKKGTADYTPWFQINYTYGAFTINQKPITVQTGSAEKQYDGTALSNESYTIVGDGLIGEDKLFVDGTSQTYSSVIYIVAGNKVEGEVEFEDNIYPWKGVVENGLDAEFNPNYAVTVQKGALTLYPITGLKFEMSGASLSKAYDGQPLKYQGTVTVDGVNERLLLPTDNFMLPTAADLGEQDIWPVGVTEDPVKVADLPIAIHFFNGADEPIECYAYTLSGAPTLTITPAEVTVTVDSFANVIYGEAAPTYTFGVTGALVAGETLDIALACEYEVGSPVGSYAITGTATGADVNKNYNITIVDEESKVTVSPKEITITIEDKEVQYGTVIPEDFAYPVAGEEALVGEDTLTYKFETTYTSTSAVSQTYPINGVLAEENANYNVTINEGTITVTKRDLVITLPTVEIVYGDAVPTLEDLTAGWTVGEGQYLGTGMPGLKIDKIEHEYTQAGDSAKLYTVHVSELDGYSFVDEAAKTELANYNISFVDGCLNVIGMMLEEVVWSAGQVHTYNGVEFAPVAIGKIPGTNEWILLETSGATYVGKYVSYINGTKSTDETTVVLNGVEYTISTDSASNYRVNMVTAGEGFFEIKEAVDTKIASASVVIAGQYSINFKIPQTAIDQYKDVTIVLHRNGADDKILHKADLVLVDGVYIISYTDIGPQSMSRTVTITLTTTRGDDDVGQSDSRDYSVAKYCYTMLERYPDDKALVNVLVAMLRYAQAAGADVDVSAYDAVVTARDVYASVENNEVVAEPAVVVKNSYDLTNGIVSRVVLTLPEGADINNYYVIVTVNGNAQKIEADAFGEPRSDGKYEALYEDSFLTAIETLTFEAYQIGTDSDSDTLVGGRVYNVESYVVAAKDAGFDTVAWEKMIDFCYALKEYTK